MKRLIAVALTTFLLCSCSNVSDYDKIISKNSSFDAAENIAGQMTLDEKVYQMMFVII